MEIPFYPRCVAAAALRIFDKPNRTTVKLHKGFLKALAETAMRAAVWRMRLQTF